jgi:hypothetical protein
MTTAQYSPDKFDSQYFNELNGFLNSEDDIVYLISDLTDDYEKFVWYIKYYISHKQKDDLEVLFIPSSETEIMYGYKEYLALHILEFFEGKLSEGELSERHKQKRLKIWEELSRNPTVYKAPERPKPKKQQEPQEVIYDPCAVPVKKKGKNNFANTIKTNNQ